MDFTTDITSGNSDKNSKAEISFILGILSLFGWLLPIVGLPLSIISLIFGVKGLKSSKIKRAKIGIILSIAGLILSIINAAYGAYLGSAGQLYQQNINLEEIIRDELKKYPPAKPTQ